MRAALQRYRSAYEQLDAGSARAIWPGVDQSALERAFQGLRWQRLNFTRCDVQVNGPAATATCHGSTDYVARIGSGQVASEPRIWIFALQKRGPGWTIDRARAER